MLTWYWLKRGTTFKSVSHAYDKTIVNGDYNQISIDHTYNTAVVSPSYSKYSVNGNYAIMSVDSTLL